MKKIIECVPNFSEGRDKNKIKQIADSIKLQKGVKLLDIDSGYDTNRTVVTFAGAPEDVIDAAFLSIKRASELINMKNHIVHYKYQYLHCHNSFLLPYTNKLNFFDYQHQ